VLGEGRLGHGTAEEATVAAVNVDVGRVEDGQQGAAGDAAVPRRLDVGLAVVVDGLEGVEVGEVDLLRADADDGAWALGCWCCRSRKGAYGGSNLPYFSCRSCTK
jgi:hypothetical protein